MNCVKYDTCEFSQSLFVGHNNPRFRGARSGNLPGLCPCPDFQNVEVQEVKETIFIENVTDGHFLKLQAEVGKLKTEVHTHIDASLIRKKKSKYD